jgi:hypothetical protein
LYYHPTPNNRPLNAQEVASFLPLLNGRMQAYDQDGEDIDHILNEHNK